MDNENVELIASNLTIAFYTGSIQHEPYLKEDKRQEPYSPNQKDRIPAISLKEVEYVYKSFCEAVRTQSTK